MRGVSLGLMGALLLAGGGGCKRLAYWSPAQDNRFAVAASEVHGAARAVAESQTIDGSTWAVEVDATTSMRVVHTTAGHDTILELRFVAESTDRTGLEALGYSLAPWSWATFGMTSAWKAAASEHKSRQFVDAVRERVSGG